MCVPEYVTSYILFAIKYALNSIPQMSNIGKPRVENINIHVHALSEFRDGEI